MESVIHFIVPALSFWNRSIYGYTVLLYETTVSLLSFYSIHIPVLVYQSQSEYMARTLLLSVWCSVNKKRIAIRQSFSGQLITQLFFLLKKMIPAAVMTAISITPAIKAESVGSEVSVGVFCETLRSVYASAYVEN